MKRLNLDQIESWLAIVESGSFREAGRRLSRSQTTVSQHVQRLEAHIGGRLLRRGKRGCALTPLGKRLAPIARALMAGETQAAQLASRSAPRLGACSNIGIYLLPHLLVTYCEHQPRPSIRIGTNPEIVEALEAGMLDMALLEWWVSRPNVGAVPWKREPMVAIYPPAHPWRERSSIALPDLCRETLIGGEPGTGTGRLLREMMSAGAALPQPAMELGSTEAVKRAVAAGLGVSIVLEMATALEVSQGTLRTIRFEPEISKTLWIARSTNMDPDSPLFVHLANAWKSTRVSNETSSARGQCAL